MDPPNSLNFNVNSRNLVHMCGYKLPITEQNLAQKRLSIRQYIVKSFLGYFFDSPCIPCRSRAVASSSFREFKQAQASTGSRGFHHAAPASCDALPPLLRDHQLSLTEFKITAENCSVLLTVYIVHCTRFRGCFLSASLKCLFYYWAARRSL